MPKPHYPTTGGPHLPSWNASDARKRHRSPIATLETTKEAQPPRSQRSAVRPPVLPASPTYRSAPDNRAGLSRPKTPPAALERPELLQSLNRMGGSAAMMWIALLLSFAALLFTVVAILHHG